MPRESLNILVYDIAMYTHANIEKTANSQVRLDARSDYGTSSIVWVGIQADLRTGGVFNVRTCVRGNVIH